MGPLVSVAQADKFPGQQVHRMYPRHALVRAVVPRHRAHRVVGRPGQHALAGQFRCQVHAGFPVLVDPHLAAHLFLVSRIGPVQTHPDRAGMSDPAELVEARHAPVRHPAQHGFVAERVLPDIVVARIQIVFVAIDEAHAAHVGGMRPRDRHDHTCRMRRIKHGGRPEIPLPLFAVAPLRHRIQSVGVIVVILRLPVHDMAEVSLPEAVAAVNRTRVIVTRLPDHIRQPRLLDSLDEIGNFLQADG